ncbi:MAG: hypothetical protein HFI92_06555 [Lachnospiraceae bacterium]|nr:hypothetical protein [Lachnospiraceae bacterium]
MAKQEYTCTVEFTEGWQERVTNAFVSLYYQRLAQGKETKPEENPENKDQASA